MKKLTLIMALMAVAGLVAMAAAEVPQLINFQGNLTKPNGEPVVDGDYDITFTIYDVASEGNTIWSSGEQSVPLAGGVFVYHLGSAVPLPHDLFSADTVRWLGIKIGTDPEIDPRTRLVAVPYAYQALRSDTADFAATLAPNAVNSTTILDGTIQLSDLNQNGAASGQVIKWNGTAWAVANDETSAGEGYWTSLDSILSTSRLLGIARGGVGHVHYGQYGRFITNLGGMACTTGIDGQDNAYNTICGGEGNASGGWAATVCGGSHNAAVGDRAFIGGGSLNKANGPYGAIGGGSNNVIDGGRSAIAGGYQNYAAGSRSTVGGGWLDSALADHSTVGGGQGNTAAGDRSTVGGGYLNKATGGFSAISGGNTNNAEGISAYVGGGSRNSVEANHSAILGGYSDTITSTAAYSYLFGIGSKLTEDSTFMVDMPHVRIGDEINGYEWPNSDGTAGQVMSTDGSGQLGWADPSSGSHWQVIDSVLYTDKHYGIARGGSDNAMYGLLAHTCTNLGGKSCTTGTPGYDYSYSVVGGGMGNAATDMSSTVSGGYGNAARFSFATVGGGFNNSATNQSATVAGGDRNYAGALQATVAGGVGDSVTGMNSFIGGGYFNKITEARSAISGGMNNLIDGGFSVIGGGYQNNSPGDYTFIGGGSSNAVEGDYSVIAGGRDNNSSGVYAFIGGGRENIVDGNYSAVVGGYRDTITSSSDYSYLFGIGSKLTEDSTFMVDMPHIRFGDETDGYEFPPEDGTYGDILMTDGSGNLSWIDFAGGDAYWQVIDSVLYTKELWGISRGDAGNKAYGDSIFSSINLGIACTTGTYGQNNDYMAIGGGIYNRAEDNYSTISGGMRNRATSQWTTVSGGNQNTASGYVSTVGGGSNNTAGGSHSTVAGGDNNSASSDYTAIVGGTDNTASNNHAVVAGGESNTAGGAHSVISGGNNNEVYGSNSFILAGSNNYVGGQACGILGGEYNNSGGSNSTILGGTYDTLSSISTYSLAFGQQVYVNHQKTAMFYDAANSGYFCVNRDSHDGSILYPLQIGTNTSNGNYAVLTASGVWTDGTGKSNKVDIQSVDGRALLDKIADLSVEQWQADKSNERHIGPSAGDFNTLFDVGTADKDGIRSDHHLAASDMAGVALAAVKELYETQKQLQSKIDEIDQLREQVARLQALVDTKLSQK